MSLLSGFLVPPRGCAFCRAFCYPACCGRWPPAMADDEFRLGKTILLGVGDHPAIIPMLACRYRPNPSWSRQGGN